MAPSKKNKSTDDAAFLKATEQQILDAIQFLPESVKPTVKKMSRYLSLFWMTIVTTMPYIQAFGSRFYQEYQKVDKDILCICYGLTACFFGVYYTLTITAVEAFRMSGWESFSKNLSTVWDSCVKVSDAHTRVREEEAKAKKPDTVTLTRNQEMAKEMVIVFHAIDPVELRSALGSLYMGVVVVYTTMKFKVAKTLTIGQSMSSQVQGLIDKVALAPMESIFKSKGANPAWASLVISYTCNSIAVMVSWHLFHLISGVHSAILGGRMAVLAAIRYGNKSGLIEKQFGAKFNPDTSYLDEVAGYTLAFIGFIFQLSVYGLPWLLSFLTLPLAISEYFLTLVMGL